MVEEVIGAVILLTHFIVIGAIILWFGLGKPESMQLFWAKLRSSLTRW